MRLQQWRSFDWVLLLDALWLIAIGLITIWSVDIARGTDVPNGKKQLFALAIGLVIFAIASFAAANFYRATAHWWYAAGIAALILVLIFGTVIRGTRGWFQIGGFSLQPIEFMKVALVLAFAKFASRQRHTLKHFSFFLGSALLVAVPMALTILQPDFGSAMLLGLFWFCMMLVVRARARYVMGLMTLVVLLGTMAWFFVLQPYQKDRLITFVDPAHDPLGAGYNITQSIIAVGSGRWVGRGLGFGSQSQLRFLPESHTDFIFAVIAEAFGFIGSLIVVGSFVLLWYRLIRMMMHTTDDFYLFVLSGALVMLAGQWMVNLGATIGLLPVTGVPMPLVSYGGSSLVATLLLLGIAVSMHVSRRGES